MAADDSTEAADSSSGSAVCVLSYNNDPRQQALLALKSFWKGEQHDHAPASWEGAPRTETCGYLTERFEMSGWHSTNLNADAWGYHQRRPNAAAPMSRCIVSAFTAAILGRPPALATPSDQRTAKYLTACWDDADGWAVLIEARNYAGVQGASAIVVSMIEGQLSFDAYWADEMHVLEWADCAGWKPLRAVYQTRVSVEQDPDEKGRVTSAVMVQTKMWTETEVVLFEDVPKDHEGRIPEKRRFPHNMGRCPVFWMQNTKNSREPEGTYDLQTPQVLELCDQLDRVQSFAVRATKANASPTLYRKDHMHWLQRGGPIRKGHGAEITGTPDGDVKFLESDGMGVTNSWETAKNLRTQIMQACNCIVPDSEWAVSNIAVETFLMLFRSMDAQCDVLQVPVRRVIREICDALIELGQNVPVLDKEKAGKGQEGIRLPPEVIVTEPNEDDINGEPETKTAAYEVGKARFVQVVWGPRQLLSPAQFGAYVGALGNAKLQSLMSSDSAVEDLANARGHDPAVEKRRIRQEKAKGKAELMANGLTPGMPGDQQVADDAAEEDDADGDGMVGEGGPEQRPVTAKKPGPEDA